MTMNNKATNKTSVLFFCVLSSPAVLAEDYFEPSALNRDYQTITDLSHFNSARSQLPGEYWVDIYLNNVFFANKKVSFYYVDGTLQPRVCRSALVNLGVRMDKLEVNNDTDLASTPISKIIPGSQAKFDFNRQRLDLNIPQAYIENLPRDWVNPALWDDGIRAFLMDYSFSGTESWKTKNKKDNGNQYLNLRSGFNYDAWRFRNYSTYSNQSSTKWKGINTYAERSFRDSKNTLTIGDSSTSGDVFDSFQFRGLKLASDPSMWPDSQRGFAPTVRGIAQSNAEVTIKQNGYIIYQTHVPAGSFEITDIYPTTSSGGLHVIIKEADGSERSFFQPFSSVPIMLRENMIRNEFTMGEYRSARSANQKYKFLQASTIYGLKDDKTLYGGAIISEKHQGISAGIGSSLGHFGSVSADVTHTKSRLATGQDRKGQQYRIQYAKNIEATGTNFTLAGYQYSTSGYLSFSQLSDMNANIERNWLARGVKKNRLVLNINQPIRDFGSLYINGYQQNYWHSDAVERNFLMGFSTNQSGVSYNIGLGYNSGRYTDKPDKIATLNVQIPLSKGQSNSWMNYTSSKSSKGKLNQQLGLSGTALENNQLSYNVSAAQSGTRDGYSGNSSAYYRSRYGEIGAGYSFDKDVQRINYSLRGGAVVHRNGITLSQSLGDTIALVEVPNADNVEIINSTGVTTDSRGYAVVPYINSYHKNRINLNPQSFDDSVEIENNSQTVIPTKGAIVVANFASNIGNRIIFKVHHRGTEIPFGAVATLRGDPAKSGIVGNNNAVYMSGMPDVGTITLRWGAGGSCQGSYSIEPNDSASRVKQISLQCE
ncbi:fimbrial assembly protein [Serratia marcescens]|uniref:Fimbrial assembly protein n=2 Tax=Serratia marcescens TaxID=615 RepID=A0ABX5N6P9_SERMA|nr:MULTISPECIES: fimbria/pilus outer membrane usher protein [Serratia]MDI9107236.1 fimbrial biogenesis outer membrane usher protein [Serratia marcescens]MDR8490423.1 fimbrial biogenesis outer membrane usher protein [Serratia nevei]MDR8533559.1 fimbrial biogenesis outer membrane usher protein [Serratia nevei]PXZ95231.1 fimbrial assembly protein [Serratia marcescens]PYA15497.1 fimbrial assembly protein [Serratia marcescens]